MILLLFLRILLWVEDKFFSFILLVSIKFLFEEIILLGLFLLNIFVSLPVAVVLV